MGKAIPTNLSRRNAEEKMSGKGRKRGLRQDTSGIAQNNQKPKHQDKRDVPLPAMWPSGSTDCKCGACIVSKTSFLSV